MIINSLSSCLRPELSEALLLPPPHILFIDTLSWIPFSDSFVLIQQVPERMGLQAGSQAGPGPHTCTAFAPSAAFLCGSAKSPSPWNSRPLNSIRSVAFIITAGTNLWLVCLTKHFPKYVTFPYSYQTLLVDSCQVFHIY